MSKKNQDHGRNGKKTEDKNVVCTSFFGAMVVVRCS